MNSQFQETQENLKGKGLEELLEEISVLPVEDMIDNFEGGTANDQKMHQLNTLLSSWYAVATDLGIIAYFGSEVEAYRFRLDYINRILN